MVDLFFSAGQLLSAIGLGFGFYLSLTAMRTERKPNETAHPARIPGRLEIA